MLEVLRDGRDHSRQDIFDAHGYMLTNNAAAELRARGYDIQHSKHDGLDVYRYVGSLAEPDPSLAPIPSSLGDASTGSGSASEPPNPEGASGVPDHLPVWDGGPLVVHPAQSALFEAA